MANPSHNSDERAEESLTADDDSCDFCGMERAVELCRGSECRQLLDTNFPLLCASCSQTLHRRYPYHHRFVDNGPSSSYQSSASVPRSVSSGRDSSWRLMANHRHHPYQSELRGERDDHRQRPLKSFARTGMSPQSSTSSGPSVGIGPVQAQRLMVAHAQQVAAAHARQLAAQHHDQTPKQENSILSSPASLSPQENASEIEVCIGDDSPTFPSQFRGIKKSVRANQLQPVHDRYDHLVQYLQANAGHSLQEAYKMTGIPRSTVLGTRAIAELKLVDANLFAETLDKAGPKVKVAELNRQCHEVLSRPDLEVVVANMRLRMDLLPFSTYQTKQQNGERDASP